MVGRAAGDAVRCRGPVWAVGTLLLVLGAALLLGGCSGSAGAVTTITAPATTIAPVTTAPSTTATTQAPTTTTSSATATSTESTTTTSEAPTTTTVATVTESDGWVRFIAGDFSIALPPNYKGGPPDSQAAQDALEEVAPDSSMSDVFRSSTIVDFHLVMFGTGGSSPDIPNVVVSGWKLPAWDSVAALGADMKRDMGAKGAQVISGTSTADRVMFAIIPPASHPGPNLYVALIQNGSYAYMVEFRARKSIWATASPVFEKAVKRIVIEKPTM